MQLNDIYAVLLIISTVMVLALQVFIIKIRNKKQIHYAFSALLSSLILWCVVSLLRIFFNPTSMLFVRLIYIGVCLTPVFLVFIGLIFTYTRITFRARHYLIFFIPILTLIIIWTNQYHNLFYVKYSDITTEVIYGKYAYVHIAYSYICIVVGLYYLVYFSIKNSGFFSKQSILFVIGSIIPLAANILFTLKVKYISSHITPISFTFLVVFLAIAIFKFKFLNIMPIALQRIVDLISDGYIVINEEHEIIDHNRALIDTFEQIIDIKRQDNLFRLLDDNPILGISGKDLLNHIKVAKRDKKAIVFEKHIKGEAKDGGKFDRYFTIELTGIYSKAACIGTVILFKDITQNKRDIQTIKEKQEILIEQERLASLGQLIGGIAHNLKTPIMSIAGGIEGLRDLVKEYRSSVGDEDVTVEDHYEIAGEMVTWLNKMKPHCSYMSDVISAVKGQAVQLNISTNISFTLDELVKRIDLLMKHEIIKGKCILKYDIQVDLNTELTGEVNSLVQIFDNMIINAIQAYGGQGGNIDFKIIRDADQVQFSITDYASGIPLEIQPVLLKQMVTTKGKNGTGLGLFMSYSNIKGRFNGNMWFESQPGCGTTFYITIPCKRKDTQG